ncbi:MAG: hypothetical protein HY744_18320 [Deltaproteobacteria bacterium]|nr:hypothetical protein [Deltaproteobacteria bacterium]
MRSFLVVAPLAVLVAAGACGDSFAVAPPPPAPAGSGSGGAGGGGGQGDGGGQGGCDRWCARQVQDKCGVSPQGCPAECEKLFGAPDCTAEADALLTCYVEHWSDKCTAPAQCLPQIVQFGSCAGAKACLAEHVCKPSDSKGCACTWYCSGDVLGVDVSCAPVSGQAAVACTCTLTGAFVLGGAGSVSLPCQAEIGQADWCTLDWGCCRQTLLGGGRK